MLAKIKRELFSQDCWHCEKKGVQAVCVPCQLSYHIDPAKPDCLHVCPHALQDPLEPAPPRPDTLARPGPREKTPPPTPEVQLQLPREVELRACGGRCGHPQALDGRCPCTMEKCGCGQRWGKFDCQGAALQGKRPYAMG